MHWKIFSRYMKSSANTKKAVVECFQHMVCTLKNIILLCMLVVWCSIRRKLLPWIKCLYFSENHCQRWNVETPSTDSFVCVEIFFLLMKFQSLDCNCIGQTKKFKRKRMTSNTNTCNGSKWVIFEINLTNKKNIYSIGNVHSVHCIKPIEQQFEQLNFKSDSTKLSRCFKDFHSSSLLFFIHIYFSFSKNDCTFIYVHCSSLCRFFVFVVVVRLYIFLLLYIPFLDPIRVEQRCSMSKKGFLRFDLLFILHLRSPGTNHVKSFCILFSLCVSLSPSLSLTSFFSANIGCRIPFSMLSMFSFPSDFSRLGFKFEVAFNISLYKDCALCTNAMSI